MYRVERVLSGSPRKRNEVIQNITKKFNIRIAYLPANCGEKKNILIEEERKWLIEFLDRSEIYLRENPIVSINI